MIIVHCTDDEREIANEFFQLFKTPWCFSTASEAAGVVLSTRPDALPPSAGLTLLFSSQESVIDAQCGVDVKPCLTAPTISVGRRDLPLYGGAATLSGKGRSVLSMAGDGATVGLECEYQGDRVLRLGYDLFGEVGHLLSQGQPAANALIPALEIHICLVRNWIVDSGVPVVEIPPVPRGYEFSACLTHDVDFVSIRDYVASPTMIGFLYRSSVGSFVEWIRGKRSLTRLWGAWRAIFLLPLVLLGRRPDYWNRFSEYSALEKGLSSTFFVIPFKDRPGGRAAGPNWYRRATRYDVDDIEDEIHEVLSKGHEIGVHGIDAWHDVEAAREEFERLEDVVHTGTLGIRMHWLLFDSESFAILDEAGFQYDSSLGFNDAVGYRAGTTQVFRPLGTKTLLELPLHIEDTAMFLSGRMALGEREAWAHVSKILDDAGELAGVVTLLWHMRSLAPERLWGSFYERCLAELRRRRAWITNAGRIVEWFEHRRAIRFEEVKMSATSVQVHLQHGREELEPGCLLRVHLPHRDSSTGAPREPRWIDVRAAAHTIIEFPCE